VYDVVFLAAGGAVMSALLYAGGSLLGTGCRRPRAFSVLCIYQEGEIFGLSWLLPSPRFETEMKELSV